MLLPSIPKEPSTHHPGHQDGAADDNSKEWNILVREMSSEITRVEKKSKQNSKIEMGGQKKSLYQKPSLILWVSAFKL